MAKRSSITVKVRSTHCTCLGTSDSPLPLSLPLSLSIDSEDGRGAQQRERVDQVDVQRIVQLAAEENQPRALLHLGAVRPLGDSEDTGGGGRQVHRHLGHLRLRNPADEFLRAALHQLHQRETAEVSSTGWNRLIGSVLCCGYLNLTYLTGSSMSSCLTASSACMNPKA